MKFDIFILGFRRLLETWRNGVVISIMNSAVICVNIALKEAANNKATKAEKANTHKN